MEVSKIFIVTSRKTTDLPGLVSFLEAFAFFHPNAQINLTGPKKVLNQISILNLKLYLHPYPEEMDSIFSAHKFAYNLNDVFNIDWSFDFEGTMMSAVLCSTIRPYKKVGPSQGLRDLFYHYKISSFKNDEDGHLKYLEAIDESFSLEAFKNRSVKKDKMEDESKPRPWKVLVLKSLLFEGQDDFLMSPLIEMIKSDEQTHYFFLTQKSEKRLEELKNCELVQFNFESFEKLTSHGQVVLSDIESLARFAELRGLALCFFSDHRKYSFSKYSLTQSLCFVSYEINEGVAEFVSYSDAQTKEKKLINPSHVIDCLENYLNREKL